MKYIIDGHYDILMDVAARRKKGERQVIRRRYYPAFQKGGVTGIVASIFVDSQYLPYGALSVAMEQISALHCEIEETPDLLMLCTSADDFLRAAETGKIGFLLSFEGAEPVSSCLLLHGFYAAGVRGLGLAWSRRNAAADGCDFSGSLKKGGLTEFGRELVKEAEAHAADDKKKQDLMSARNQADGLIYGTEKSIKDLGDKLDAALKSDIEGKIASLKTLMEGEDVEAIKKATEELAQASHKLAEQLYSQAQGQQPGADAAGAAGAQPGAGAAGGKKADDDVIDADFTESK